MIAVVITLKSATTFPPAYVVRRIMGSAPAFYEQQQLQAYLEGHEYCRIHKPLRSHDQWIGL